MVLLTEAKRRHGEILTLTSAPNAAGKVFFFFFLSGGKEVLEGDVCVWRDVG